MRRDREQRSSDVRPLGGVLDSLASDRSPLHHTALFEWSSRNRPWTDRATEVACASPCPGASPFPGREIETAPSAKRVEDCLPSSPSCKPAMVDIRPQHSQGGLGCVSRYTGLTRSDGPLSPRPSSTLLGDGTPPSATTSARHHVIPAPATGAYSSAERSNVDVRQKRELNHADLIARAREVSRETAGAIEQAKASTWTDRTSATRLEAAWYSQGVLSRPSRDSGLAPQTIVPSEPRALLSANSLAALTGVTIDPHSGVLPSTLAVEALRASEPARMRMATSSYEAGLLSPRPAATRAQSVPQREAGFLSPRPAATRVPPVPQQETLLHSPRPASGALLSPHPAARQRALSPQWAETHPDLNWGATALHRPPLHPREQLWSPRLDVTAYPPSPEGGLHAPLHASASATLLGLDNKFTSRQHCRGRAGSSPQRILGEKREAWSSLAHNFSALAPVTPERYFSPQPGSRLCTGRSAAGGAAVETLHRAPAGVGNRSLWEIPTSWGKASLETSSRTAWANNWSHGGLS